eukprot:7380330-Prymnesium_polylepis.4
MSSHKATQHQIQVVARFRTALSSACTEHTAPQDACGMRRWCLGSTVSGSSLRSSVFLDRRLRRQVVPAGVVVMAGVGAVAHLTTRWPETSSRGSSTLACTARISCRGP